MKKKILALVIASALIASVTGCNQKSETDASAQTTTEPAQTTTENNLPEQTTEPEQKNDEYALLREKMSESDLCAVAYLGGCESQSEIRGVILNSDAISDYPFIADIPDERVVAADGGWDIYCIVPATDDTKITVNSAELDENAEISKTGELYSATGDAILLYCNVSDILSNTLVTVTSGSESLSFSPHISLRDGSVETAENVYDFSPVSPTVAE